MRHILIALVLAACSDREPATFSSNVPVGSYNCEATDGHGGYSGIYLCVGGGRAYTCVYSRGDNHYECAPNVAPTLTPERAPTSILWIDPSTGGVSLAPGGVPL